MNRLLVGLTAALMTLVVAYQASAADMPFKAPVKHSYDPCGVARFTGFYFGGNVGGLGFTAQRDDLDGYLTDNTGWTATDLAATAGVQAGYDFQSCNKVFGIVGDLNWTNAEATTLEDPNDPNSNGLINSRMHWFATLRTRAGLAVNNALFYVTGGLAAARIKTTISETVAVTESFEFNKTRWGAVGGAGVEYAAGNHWSLNAEVLYMQFRKQDVSFFSPVVTSRQSFDLNDSAWVVRVGLNYRFDDARPVTALSYAKRYVPPNPCGPRRFNGGYVGGNVGAVAYTANRNDLDNYLSDNDSYTATDIAGTAGAQIGFDWQDCNYVLGAVADLNWTNAKATTNDDPNDAGTRGTIDSRMRWFTTIRGRAGLAVNDTLVYVTGGLAAANTKTTISEVNPGVSSESFEFSKTRWGLVGGAGAEFTMWNRWSLATEILYMQFAKQSVTFFSPAQNNTSSFDFNDSAWVARAALNYRWGDPGPAHGVLSYAKGYVPSDPCGPRRFNGGYVGGNVSRVAYSANRNDLDGFLTDNGSWNQTDIAFAGGAQVGFDWQGCNRVIGVVADGTWTDARAFKRDDPNDPTDNNFIDSRMRWFATLRARGGLAVNNVLVYVTGGLAAAKIKTTVTDNADTATFSDTRWGLVGGFGAEYRFAKNWSAGTEVLYMQFEKKNETFAFPIFGVASFDFNDSAWVGRFTLNYRWGGDDVVVARN